MAEMTIAELEKEIERTNRKLENLMAELVEQKMYLEDAEKDIKRESEEHIPSYEFYDYYEPNN